jgi:hypothetical protein
MFCVYRRRRLTYATTPLHVHLSTNPVVDQCQSMAHHHGSGKAFMSLSKPLESTSKLLWAASGLVQQQASSHFCKCLYNTGQHAHPSVGP